MAASTRETPVALSAVSRVQLRGAKDFAERANPVAELVVAQVRRRSEPEHIAAGVAVHAAFAQAARKTDCRTRSYRQKAASALVGHRLDGCDRGSAVESFEFCVQQLHLVKVDCVKPVRRQPLLLEEIEYGSRSVM